MAGGINPFGFAVSAPQPAPRAPIDLPSAPFGFAPPPSKWEQTAAILNEYNPIDAFWRLYNSDMAKGGAITDQNIEDGMMVGGTVMGGGAMIPKPANALNMGIRAYHGSPHSFDKFSMDKIGTGEGAQAYGHGLYFAENENIAASYRDSLSPGTKYKGGSRYQVQDGTPEGSAINAVMDLVTEGMSPADALSAVKKRYVDAANSMDPALFEQGSLSTRAANAGRYRGYMEIADAIDGLNADDFVHVPGSMYEVDIDADPNAFLDWDKPLSEQPEVMGKLPPELRAKIEERAAVQGAPTGANAYAWATPRKDGVMPPWDTAATSQALKEAGIPGIKYLDAGSRGAGDGTRNFVVFDDNLISIVRKYGIAGASAMLGYNLLENVNPAQADELKRIEAGK